MEKMQFPNYEELEVLYSIYKPSQVPCELQKVKQYLLNGYNWYIKNIENGQTAHDDDHEQNIDLVKDLIDLSEAMTILSGSYICLVHEESQSQVNITPFINFIQEEDLKHFVNRMRVVQIRMRDYLHDSNILDYKSCSKFMDEMDFVFTWILKG